MQGILPNENIDIHWLCNALKFLHLEKYATKATVPNLYFRDYGEALLRVPDYEDQKRISGVLRKIETIIEKKGQETQKLDNLIKARFVEMFGDVYHSSKYSKKKWNGIVTIKNGRDYKRIAVQSGGYPVYGTGGEMARASDFLCPENTIIVGRKGTINNPLLVKERFWNVDTAFGVIPSEELHYLYLFWFCKMYDFSKLNKQAVLPSTTKADLLDIEMQVPPISIQCQFASFVLRIDKSKFALLKCIDRLSNPAFRTDLRSVIIS